MNQPKFIQPGDRIACVAPSFGVTTEPYETRAAVAKKQWEKMGYQVEEGACVHRNDGVASSASPEERAQEWMEAYSSDCSLLISVGGGETMNEILPFIDFEAIKHMPPKWFMGFSDNTNLTFTLATLSNLVTIYGPCAPQFFQKKFRLSEKDAMAMLRGEKHFEGYPKYSITHSNPLHPLLPYRLSQAKVITPSNYRGPFTGTFLGGCLDCLVGLCGTKYDRVKEFEKEHPEGIIWFLEACDLSPLGIRRALFQLKEAGWFNNAIGFLVGRPLCMKQELFGVTPHSAVMDILGDLGCPILLDVDLGHISPSMPFKTGARGTVSFVDGNLVIDYAK